MPAPPSSPPHLFDLEDRLVDFGVRIIQLVESFPRTLAAQVLGSQIIRSGTSPGLNYGEAQAAESRKDFVHKLKVVLKELRETRTCLRIILRTKLPTNREEVTSLLAENEQLNAIFAKSIQTAQRGIRNPPDSPHPET
jgi:four helix bundle protein